MRWWRWAAVAVALAAVAGGGVWWALKPTPVDVVRPTLGTAARVVYAPGGVEPQRWAKVTSLVRERIVERAAREGDAIDEGGLLFLLDDSEPRAHSRELQAQLNLATQELNRASDLLDRQVGSLQRYEEAQAEVRRLEAAVAAAEVGLRRYRITAPLAGRVLRLEGEVGEIAEPGDILAWVGQPRPLEVVAEVNEEDIPLVEVGQRALLKADAFPGQVIEGEVARITPLGDPQLRTYRVRLAVPDDNPLRVGMSVEANIVAEVVEGALLVPLAALRDGSVLVAEDGRAVAREVETGIAGSGDVQITAGLGVDDAVVAPWPEGLEAGRRIEPILALPPAGAPGGATAPVAEAGEGKP